MGDEAALVQPQEGEHGWPLRRPPGRDDSGSGKRLVNALGNGGKMPRLRVNDVELYYDVAGDGDPLVLVHGSWGDHSTWQGVVPTLAQSFRVVTYDRRGHSRSERSSGQGSRREDEADLAALMEALGCAPAHVAGNSFGASIALGLAARRSELFRSVSAHEPPLLAVVANDPEVQPLMHDVQAKVQSVLEQLEGGDIAGGTRRFVEDVALGPGMWQQLPEEARDVMVNNASTFLDEARDPEWATFGLMALADFPRPVLLTQGDHSPRWFLKIIETLAQATKRAEVRTIRGAGHIPHATHPVDYVAILTDFVRRSR